MRDTIKPTFTVDADTKGSTLAKAFLKAFGDSLRLKQDYATLLNDPTDTKSKVSRFNLKASLVAFIKSGEYSICLIEDAAELIYLMIPVQE